MVSLPIGAPAPAPTPEFLALQDVVKGRYSLERELGRGGMGVVFLARDVALDRLVAIKLLPPDLAHREDLRALFLHEARTAAGLSHPNIVPIHAVEEHGALVFFVMTYVDGETLGARVRRRGPLPAAEVMRVTQEVAWALAHAHARGVVHRDVKPDNILLERDTGRALVTDFGIARVVQSLDPAGAAPIGTPQYMSPEQARGAAVDGRSDLYSLGVTAWFAAAGRLPFESSSNHTLLLMHAEQPAPPVRAAAPRLPADFADAVDRLLAKAPADRFASGDALAVAVGEARGAVGTVPAAVRRYIEISQQAATEIGTLLTVTAAIVVGMEILKLLQGDFLGITTVIEVIPTIALGGIAAARAGQLFADTRRLLAEGYRHDAVRLGIVAADREHAASQPPTSPGTRFATWLRAGAGIAVTAVGFAVLNADHWPNIVQALGGLVAVTAPAVAVHRLVRDLRAGKPGTLWHRLLEGRLGRLLFRLTGRTVRAARLAPSAEPTAVLLARATEDLYHGLPGELRRQLAEVPALLARLQADAAALRQLDPADPVRASRLSTTVTAIENLRLDLLRLHAGQVLPDELTADLDRARELGRRVDAVAEAREPTPA
jgi:eukaryotic-like serine/threonine-protein kinase